MWAAANTHYLPFGRQSTRTKAESLYEKSKKIDGCHREWTRSGQCLPNFVRGPLDIAHEDAEVLRVARVPRLPPLVRPSFGSAHFSSSSQRTCFLVNRRISLLSTVQERNTKKYVVARRRRLSQKRREQQRESVSRSTTTPVILDSE